MMIRKLKTIPALATAISILLSQPAAAQYIFWNTDKYVSTAEISTKEIKKQANIYADDQIKGYVNAYLANYPAFKRSSCNDITDTCFINASVDIYRKDLQTPVISAKDVNFQLGQDILPDAVEKAIVGTNTSAKRTLTYMSPECKERYGDESVRFEITVNAVVDPKYVTYDDLTDSFAQKLKFASSAELINTLQAEAAKNLAGYKKEAVYEAVRPLYQTQIPDFLVRQEANEYKELIINQDFSKDKDLFEQYIKNTYGSDEAFDKELQADFIQNIEKDLVLTKLGKDLGIRTEGEAYEENISAIAQAYGYDTKEDLYDAFTTSYESGKDYIDRQYLISSAVNALCDYKIKEAVTPDAGQILSVTGDKNGLKYSVPKTRGFKSYMDYRTITSTTSQQYRLQQYAQTSYNGIRTVNGRYCIALGTYFGGQIGQYCDITLENGTVIECILGDIKADKDTEADNIVGKINNCCSEFIIDKEVLPSGILLAGNVSKLYENWDSPVKDITIYNIKAVL